MAWAEPRPNEHGIHWFVYYRINGIRQKPLDGGYTEHTRKLGISQALAYEATGRGPQAEGKISVNAAFEEYIRKCRQRNLDPGTIKMKNESLERFKKKYGHLPLSKIDKSVMSEHGDWLITNFKPFGVNIKLRDLRAFFKFCVDEEWISKNIAKRISFADCKDVWRYITTDEVMEILNACRFCPDLPEIVVVALNTGLRISELIGIKKKDIINDHYIYVKKKKRGRDKMVPISDILMPIFNNRFAGTQSSLFPTWTRGRLEQSFRRAKIRSGITGRLRFHDLRHTFASNYLMAGNKEIELMGILGHTNLRTTAIYSHFASTYLRANMNKMSFPVTIPKVIDFNQNYTCKKVDGIWQINANEADPCGNPCGKTATNAHIGAQERNSEPIVMLPSTSTVN